MTTHPQDAQAFATEATKDPAVVAARFNAAREQLVSDPHVDPKRIGAIGYDDPFVPLDFDHLSVHGFLPT